MRLLFILLALCVVVSEAGAQEDGSGAPLLDPFGDFRLRLEQDWDSRSGDGTELDDRLRLRFRVRAGLAVNLSDEWRARVQLRSGPHDSQQSPHITIYDFDGGSNGPYQFNFDYWYLSFRTEGLEIWAGRNQLSYWHHRWQADG